MTVVCCGWTVPGDWTALGGILLVLWFVRCLLRAGLTAGGPEKEVPMKKRVWVSLGTAVELVLEAGLAALVNVMVQTPAP